MADHELDASELVAWRNAVMSPWGPPLPLTRHVLITLSQQMGFELSACPSVELLAVRTGMAEKSVRNHLKKAIERGWITSWRETRKGRSWYFTRYQGEWPNDLDPEAFKPGSCRPSEWRELSEDAQPPRPVTDTTRQDSRPVTEDRQLVNEDATTGKSGHDGRYDVPTNSFTNSSLKAFGEHHAARDVFSPFENKNDSSEGVRHGQPYSVADSLWVEVSKAGGYFEKPAINFKAAQSAKQLLDQLIMRHGETRVHEAWTQLDTQDIEHLEQEFNEQSARTR